MFGTFMLNLLCAVVPCDPEFRMPEIASPSSLRLTDGRRFAMEDDIKYPVVLTQNGAVQGYPMLSSKGLRIHAFEGIPYGEPPVGYFRFRAPVPRRPWIGVLKAFKPGPDCLQVSPTKMFRVHGNEDCLYLNIYSAKMPKGDKKLNPKLPVIVWLHGGSFYYGSGSEYGPSYLLDEKVVLVTLNYRLGILGFLSLGNGNAPGNYGLKDQALALKWVHDNIEKFGGDPKKVTLVGHSAGGASVHLHMVSNVTRNYFHAAVSMSGTAFNGFGFKNASRVRRYTEKIASKFFCLNQNLATEMQAQDLVNCLRNRDPMKLVDSQRELQEWGPFPITIFAPVAEPATAVEPFLTQSPMEAYARGDVAKIPWIATLTENEGLYPLLISYGMGMTPSIRKHFTSLAPRILNYDNLDPEAARRVTKQVTKFYFGQSSLFDVSDAKLSEPFSDRIFTAEFHDALLTHAKLAPTYAYMFRYKGKYNVANFMGIDADDWGVGHGEDVFYMFNSSMYYHGFQQVDCERKLSELMVNLVSNFAKTTEPTLTVSNGSVIHIWDPVDTKKVEFLELNHDVHMIIDPLAERATFWNNLELDGPK